MLTSAVTFFCLSTGGGRKNVKGRNLLGVEGPHSAGKGSLSKTMRLGEKIRRGCLVLESGERECGPAPQVSRPDPRERWVPWCWRVRRCGGSGKKLFEGVLERARRWPRALRCRIPIKLRGVQWVELRRKTGAREAGLEGAWS